MLVVNKTINFYGNSYLSGEDSMTGKQLANMDASIDNNGVFRINKYIASKEAYEQYSDIIEADWAEFETEVKSYIVTE